MPQINQTQVAANDPEKAIFAVKPHRMPRNHRSAYALAAMSIIALSGCAGGPAGQGYNGSTALPEIRMENGLLPLVNDSELTAAAAAQAASMAKSKTMSHTTIVGGSFSTRLKKVETRGGAAENIAYGAFGTDELFRRWMNSPPHRRNILNPAFTRYGLASAPAHEGKHRYWALLLAR